MDKLGTLDLAKAVTNYYSQLTSRPFTIHPKNVVYLGATKKVYFGVEFLDGGFNVGTVGREELLNYMAPAFNEEDIWE